jgi:hypothetical protein
MREAVGVEGGQDFTSREKPREDRIRVKVRWILFGINGQRRPVAVVFTFTSKARLE